MQRVARHATGDCAPGCAAVSGASTRVGSRQLMGQGSGLTVGAIVALAILAGCSDLSGEPKFETLSAEQIYTLAEQELERRPRRDTASRYFSEVERLYPYSEWAKRALVMQAFALHKRGAYAEARGAAQRYIDLYPADEDAAYAQYILAISYYDEIDEIGRDQGLTFQALQALRAVIEGYPNSEYARSAMLKFDLAFDHLAAKEMEIGRYYLARRHYAPAINRFRVVVEQFQTTTHTAEALHRLVEAYLALGLTDEAQTAGAILGYNYRSSPFYDDSFRLLTGRGLNPEARGQGWLRTVYRQMIRGEWL
jgi:outer membrane protein assembly factor BamD